mmetsp:Transcript_530/g.1547  ORF Transcript_530/g.1547 Transcript_530/m.1547 type:complete len:148 (-) Transcript_530:1177-1620(-)
MVSYQAVWERKFCCRCRETPLLSRLTLRCTHSCTYITRGKGDPQSWNSSSHGAGRTMSRTRARKEIAQNDFERAMKGVVCDTNEAVKDEAPQAYKDLDVVMKNQDSLTEIVYKLQPLINVKGFETKGTKRGNKRQKHRKENPSSRRY